MNPSQLPDHRGRLLVKADERGGGVTVRWTKNKEGEDPQVLVTCVMRNHPDERGYIIPTPNYVELEVASRTVHSYFKVHGGIRKRSAKQCWHLRVPMDSSYRRVSPFFGTDELVGNFASEADAIEHAVELVRGMEARRRLRGT